MVLRIPLERGICGNAGRRCYYTKNSRSIQTRRHGITLTPSVGTRTLSSTSALKAIEPDEATRKALDNFKATIRNQIAQQHPMGFRSMKHRVGSKGVAFQGYFSKGRDVSKNLTFALLRDEKQNACVQLVSAVQEGDLTNLEAHTTLRSLKDWTPVRVIGTIKERTQRAKENTIDGMLLHDDVEIEVESIQVLNQVPDDLLLKKDTVFPPEQRHLQIRINREVRENLLFRSKKTGYARRTLGKARFTEIETPILFKSTPEGAREFLVPTRTKGLAYALPQSPQQYKQILMASGITRYFQFARCFRDEDLRADRQPEFTQLDIEMAFEGEDRVMPLVEHLLESLFDSPDDIKTPFQKMTYQEAMATYGSDKPDLRFGMEIQQVTDIVPQDLIKKITDLNDPIVELFKIKGLGEPKATKKFVAEFLDSPEGKPFLNNPDGQPGVFVIDTSRPQFGTPFGHDYVIENHDQLVADHGDLLVLQARKNEPFSGGSTALGNLRLALHKAAVSQGLLEQPTGFKFLWVTDFPLFTPSNDTDPGQGGSAGFSSTHHPFTAPKTAEDVELLLTAPEKAIAAHYDIVVNGVEIGGGSRRIHNAEVQEFIFRDILKMSSERIEDFRHLLDALRSGCPPHAGIALGWDRLMAVMLGKESVRDVIVFPKSSKGEDMLVKSPNVVTKKQWDTYHLQVKE